jgi:hypothetical protein
MAVALLEERLAGASPCMRCSLINDLMKTTAKVAGPIRVVSGLAPRWVAKPPNQAILFCLEYAVSLLGPLRSPARDKPAHYNIQHEWIL